MLKNLILETTNAVKKRGIGGCAIPAQLTHSYYINSKIIGGVA